MPKDLSASQDQRTDSAAHERGRANLPLKFEVQLEERSHASRKYKLKSGHTLTFSAIIESD
eukprot:scaffold5843_cov14-Prasinocladus_malaysianus.AAC.1